MTDKKAGGENAERFLKRLFMDAFRMTSSPTGELQICQQQKKRNTIFQQKGQELIQLSGEYF